MNQAMDRTTVETTHVAATVASPEPGLLPAAVWTAVSENFGDLLEVLRYAEPFRSLDAAPWAVVVSLLNAWQWSRASSVARRLARASGCSVRTVFRHIAALEDKGIVRPLPEPFVGSYGVGPVLGCALQTFARDRDAGVWSFSGFRIAEAMDSSVTGETNTHDAGAEVPTGSAAVDPIAIDTPANLTGGTHDIAAGVAPRIDTTAILTGGTHDIVTGVAAASAARHPILVDTHDTVTGGTHDTVAGVSPRIDTTAILTGGTHDTVAGATVPDGGVASRATTTFAYAKPANTDSLRTATPLQPLVTRTNAPTPCQNGAPPSPPPLLNNKNNLRSSSSSERRFSQPPSRPYAPAGSARPVAATPAPVLDSQTSRRVACLALAALHHHVYPEVSLPRSFDPADVALIERCGANGTWDATTLAQMHQDAVRGAAMTSSGPPRPFYIWGRFTHFLEHARKGKAEREKAAAPRPSPKKPQPEEAPASPAWVSAHIAEALKHMFDKAPTPRPSYPPADSPSDPSSISNPNVTELDPTCD